MKIKISKSELNKIIQEEVERFNRIKQLEENKKQLEEALQRLNEGEDIDEGWFNNMTAGMGNLRKVAANKAGQAVAGAANKMGHAVGNVANQAVQGVKQFGQGIKQDVVGAGQDIAAGARKVGSAVGGAASAVKNTYQQGVVNQMKIDIPKQIEQLKEKQQQLQQQYQQITGSFYNSQHSL